MGKNPKIDREQRSVQKASIELMLDSLGVGHMYYEVWPLDKIDVEASRRNQAREKPLDPEHVEELRAALANGATLPPVIGHVNDKGLLVLLGGNHRQAAHEAFGAESISAYDVKASSQDIRDAIMVADNSTHGLAMSDEERIVHGLNFMDKGVTAQKAAALVGVAMFTLKNRKDLRDADLRARRLDIKAEKWESLRGSSRIRLGNISTDEVFQRAALLAADAALNVEACNHLVATLNKFSSLAEQVNYIDSERERLSADIQKHLVGLADDGTTREQRKARQMPPAHRLRMALSSIDHISLDAHAMVAAIREQPEEVQATLKTLISKVGNDLVSTFMLLNTTEAANGKAKAAKKVAASR